MHIQASAGGQTGPSGSLVLRGPGPAQPRMTHVRAPSRPLRGTTTRRPSPTRRRWQSRRRWPSRRKLPAVTPRTAQRTQRVPPSSSSLQRSRQRGRMQERTIPSTSLTSSGLEVHRKLPRQLQSSRHRLATASRTCYQQKLKPMSRARSQQRRTPSTQQTQLDRGPHQARTGRSARSSPSQVVAPMLQATCRCAAGGVPVQGAGCAWHVLVVSGLHAVTLPRLWCSHA